MLNDDINKNPKRFWSFIKSKRCDASGVAPLTKDGTTHSDSLKKANILNDQFTSVFTSEDTTCVLELDTTTHPKVPDFSINQKGVLKLLSGLNPHKATGPDGISGQFLKVLANEITPSLTLIYEASITQGKIPSDWKNAYVTPPFKKGDRSKPSNYQPVSLTTICCTILENIIFSVVMKHLETNNILTESQHGFRKSHSCESQLLLTVEDLASSLNKNQQVDAILLDFSKAFDKVPNQRLLAKIKYYGIRDNLNNWISDFLGERKQEVVLEGKHSTSSTVTSGASRNCTGTATISSVHKRHAREHIINNQTIC